MLQIWLTVVIASWAPSLVATCRASDGLQPHEFEAVAQVIHAALSAVGDPEVGPVCVTVADQTLRTIRAQAKAQKPLVDHLRRRHLSVSAATTCYRPSDPQGLVIDVTSVVRKQEGDLLLRVDLVDQSTGGCFADLLMRGTYRLRKNREDSWRIVTYTDETAAASQQPRQTEEPQR
jgi:hypothetical protein